MGTHTHTHTHQTQPHHLINQRIKGWMDKRKKEKLRVRRIKHVEMLFFSMSACFEFKGLGQGQGKKVWMRTLWLGCAFASTSAFSKVSRILCVPICIPDRILTPGYDSVP